MTEFVFVKQISERRGVRHKKDHCLFCGTPLGEFATYPFNRQGSFSRWYHSACIEKVAKWFKANNYLIEWENLKVLDRFNNKVG